MGDNRTASKIKTDGVGPPSKLEPEAIERICEAVNSSNKVSLPDNLDRQSLASDLDFEFAIYANWSALSSNRDSKALYDHLRTTKSIAYRLAERLDQKRIEETLSSYFSHGLDRNAAIPPLSALKTGLKFLILALSLEQDRRLLIGLDNTAPLNLLEDTDTSMKLRDREFVHRLGAVYKTHFLREPGVSKHYDNKTPLGNQPYGPFIRFCQAVYAEAGENKSSGAIEAIWDRSRQIGTDIAPE